MKMVTISYLRHNYCPYTIVPKDIITNIEGRKVKLTNLDKILYPSIGVIKAELIQTYMQLAPFALPHLEDRPLTMIRFPDGVNEKRFYSKNKPTWTPEWIPDVKVEHENDTIRYILANELATLAWTANLAALDLHPMQVKSKHMDKPDQFIFDLDPSPQFGFDRVKELALSLKEFLEGYGYHAFVKTSGSKGLHIYIPLVVDQTIDKVFEAFKKISQEYVAAHKDTTTLGMTKEKRKGKVLLDIYRNHKSQTCAAPYTTRAREGAPISTPFRWESMDQVESSKQWNVRTIMDYLKEEGDPWANFFEYASELHTVRKAISVAKDIEGKDDKVEVIVDAEASEKLAKYDTKRDFEKTSEPSAEPVAGNDDRFVIQLHDASSLHYDLRLEQGGVLLSWAIPKGFPSRNGVKRLAIETEPHPVKYLTFEGVIPKSEYGGGTMWIFDTGKYEIKDQTPKKITFTLKGKLIKGTFTLVKTRDSQWLLSTKQDLDFGNYKVKPMLASMAKKVPSKKDYFYEVKWDGIRVTASIWHDEVKLLSRSGRDITERFPLIVEQLKDEMSHSAVIDGEIVALEANGAPNFAKVISRMHTSGKNSIERASKRIKTSLYAFDCTVIDGVNICNLPIEKRREWLRTLFDDREHLRFSNTFEDGEGLFAAAESMGLEGIMAKRRGARYVDGKRSEHWLKIKVRHDDEAILIGYTKGKGDRSGSFGSLHLAKINDGVYSYMGKVGTGYDHEMMKEIFANLSELKKVKKPIKNKIDQETETIWIEEAYTIKIQYASMTDNGTYREPVFKAMLPIENKVEE